MQINDLQPKQGNVNIKAELIEKEEPREFEKFGKKGKVCNAKIKDESGTIKLTLWNEDIDKVKVGDKIQIKNGFVSEWNNIKQLSVGKYGTLEVENEDDEIEKELDELEKQDKEIEKLSKLEKEFENKDSNEEDVSDIKKEIKELERLENKSNNQQYQDIEKEIEDVKENEDKEKAITLDELEEHKIIENENKEEKEEYNNNNENLSKDFVEEEVIDEDK